MNQETVIYIILSAILLYLYYRRRDLSILIGFIVLVSSTLIFGKDVREGAKNKSGSGSGSGSGSDECKKMGFKQPEIDKKDIKGSLEKVTKNIEKVAETYWGFEKGDIEGKSTKDEKLEKSWSAIKNIPYIKSLIDGQKREDTETILVMFIPAYELYEKFIIRKLTAEEKDTFLKDKIMTKLDETVKGIDSTMEIVEKIENSDETKDLDKDAKKLLKYISCLVKQWASIFKALKAAGSGEKNKKKSKKDDDDDDE
jgi:hypothetical protein